MFIQKAFDIEPHIIAQAFGIECDNVSSVQDKTLESLYEERNFPIEIGTKSIRLFVALYKGLPIEDDAGITKQALDILMENSKIPKEQYDSLMETAIDLYDEPANNNETKKPKTIEKEHRSSSEITGSTTIEQALTIGIDKDFLEKQIGDISKKDKTETIRDIAKSQGLSFGQIKTILNDSLS
jgi:hypothetical protein